MIKVWRGNYAFSAIKSYKKAALTGKGYTNGGSLKERTEVTCDNCKPYKADLTLPVMTVVWYVMLSGATLTLGFPAETRQENRPLLTVRNRDSQLVKGHPPFPSCGSHRKNETFRDLEPIIIKMKIINAKFKDNKRQFAKFYRSLPSPNKTKPSVRSSHLKHPKIQVSQLEEVIRKIDSKLKFLIYVEKSQCSKNHDSQEGRLELLKDFKAETRNLLEELRHYRRGKGGRRKMSKGMASANLSCIEFLTELRTEEWAVLTTLKRTLRDYIQNFKLFFKYL